MSVKKRGLGRSLDALLSSGAGDGAASQQGDELRELAVDQLVPGRHQPRQHFDEAALAQLADSIRAQGVVQPLVVRASGRQFEIVAGERRWRAAKLAGLKVVPVIVRALEEREAMAIALVENIQRADLNPLEEAEALRKLIDECGLTHEACAQAVGRSRAQVSNLLRVMELPAEVQTLLRHGQLSLGHAKVLLAAPAAHQAEYARQVVARQLTVRQTEALLKAPATRPEAPAKRDVELERRISSALGMAVQVQAGTSGRGKLVIRYRDPAELQRLLSALEG